MENRKRYATLATIAIMVVFYTASVVLSEAFLTPPGMNLALFAIVLGALQVSLGLAIIFLMKREGSFVPNEHRLNPDRTLFSVLFIWIFIIFKFIAVFVMINDLRHLGGVRQPQLYEFLLVILFAITVGFFEEYLFRGLLFRNYLVADGDAKVIQAAFVSALIFGIVHIDPISSIREGLLFLQLPNAIVAAGVGYYLAAAYYKTGKMVHVIILHTLFNLSTFLLAPFLDMQLLSNFPGLVVAPIQPSFGAYVPNLLLATAFFFFGHRMLKDTQAQHLRQIESEQAMEAIRQAEAEQMAGFPVVHNSTEMGTIEEETALGKDESCLD